VVELIEYLLVFGVTASLAGFSILVFGGFLPTLHQTQGQAELDQIAGAAGLAAQNGSAGLVLTMNNASVACSGDVVQLSTGGATFTTSIGASCDFSASNLNGVCKLVFTRTEAGVGMEVG
jgi:hypothetical protein